MCVFIKESYSSVFMLCKVELNFVNPLCLYLNLSVPLPLQNEKLHSILFDRVISAFYCRQQNSGQHFTKRLFGSGFSSYA